MTPLVGIESCLGRCLSPHPAHVADAYLLSGCSITTKARRMTATARIVWVLVCPRLGLQSQNCCGHQHSCCSLRREAHLQNSVPQRRLHCRAGIKHHCLTDRVHEFENMTHHLPPVAQPLRNSRRWSR